MDYYKGFDYSKYLLLTIRFKGNSEKNNENFDKLSDIQQLFNSIGLGEISAFVKIDEEEIGEEPVVKPKKGKKEKNDKKEKKDKKGKPVTVETPVTDSIPTTPLVIDSLAPGPTK